ncbi:hypothetical protein [Sphingomonas elodea]|uniref:hypothetical protein n=1 Tax=Sphingomonas elodea TaxID=179878 RepID=UPI00111075E3|nr:hypothetical protein [Sphingomonas elodea]
MNKSISDRFGEVKDRSAGFAPREFDVIDALSPPNSQRLLVRRGTPHAELGRIGRKFLQRQATSIAAGVWKRQAGPSTRKPAASPK